MSTSKVTTTCVLDCPDTCSLEVTVEGGRVSAIDAAAGNPVTGDFICSKVRRFDRRLYHRERLLHPMRRRGEKGSASFEPIAWEQALEVIAERLGEIRDRFGGEAILPYDYGGSNGFVSEEFIDSLFFARLGASRLDKTICAAPTSAVASDMYGKMAGVAFADYPEAELIILWGANPRASNIHLVPFLREAKSRGAFIAVVDPIRVLSKELVDLHLPVYPGTDLPVALALIEHWRRTGSLDETFLERETSGAETLLEAARDWTIDRAAEEAAVDPRSIEALAERYAEASPALIRCGWGLERNQNGGQAAAAILAMPALAGKFGCRGGGYTLSNSGPGRMDGSLIWDLDSWQSRSINMTELGRVLNDGSLDPPVQGLFVFNCNPVASIPDQNEVIRGLMREDLFTVVFDQVMTDSAAYADILLPATTFLEHRDIKRSYGSYVVGATEPAIEPCGEARSNLSVFQALGKAMRFEDEPFGWSEEEALERARQAIRIDGEPVDGEALRRGGMLPYDFDGSSPVQFENVRPGTADGRVELTPRCLGARPYRYRKLRSPDFPLALLSPATSRTVNSTLGEFNLETLELSLHPEDAEARGIGPGDGLRVFNELGEVHCSARIDEAIRRGVVHLPKGAWAKSSRNGRTSVALTPATLNEVAGGACFNDARVQVERL